MSKILITHLTVAASVEDVWETHTDLAGHRHWNPFITAAAGALSVGGRLHRLGAGRPVRTAQPTT